MPSPKDVEVVHARNVEETFCKAGLDNVTNVPLEEYLNMEDSDKRRKCKNCPRYFRFIITIDDIKNEDFRWTENHYIQFVGSDEVQQAKEGIFWHLGNYNGLYFSKDNRVIKCTINVAFALAEEDDLALVIIDSFKHYKGE